MQLFSFFHKQHPFTKYCLSFSKWSLFLLFFLFPVFFLPWTSDVLEINKQTLFVFLVLLSLLGYLGALMLTKTIVFRYSRLFFVFPLFFLAALFSTLFNQTGFLSWVGESLQEYTSVLTIGIDIIFVFLIIQLGKEDRFFKNSFFALLLSGIFVALIGIGSFLGLNKLPFALAQSQIFNTIGNVNSFGLFLSLLLVFSCGYWVISKKINHFFLGAAILLDVLALSMLDYWVPWVVVLLGLGSFFLLAFFQDKDFIKRTKSFLLPMTVFLFSLLFLILPSPFQKAIPIEVAPSLLSTKQILAQTWQEHSFLFGSGPGTYVNDYVKYKPLEINDTPFWDVRFDRSSSQIFTLATTLGVFGAGLFLLMLGLLCFLCLKKIRAKEHQEKQWAMILLPVCISFVAASFFYSSNISLQILFFFFAGVVGSVCANRVVHWDLQKHRQIHPMVVVFFIFVSLGIFVTLFLTGFRYAAETAFAKAIRLERSGANSQEVVNALSQAAFLNQYQDVYYRNLAQGLLQQVKETLVDRQKNISEEQSSYLQELVAAAINASVRATELAPNNVLNWSVRARLFAQVVGLVPQAQMSAKEAFEKAGELEPKSPIYPTEMGKLLVFSAIQKTVQEQEEKQKIFDEAEGFFQQALALKKDFASAHYQLVLLYKQENRMDDAIGKMESLASFYPEDTNVWFQLGLLYVQRNKEQDMNRAQYVLERAVMLSPTNANALWFLGFVYEQKGNVDLAIKMIERVQELNPDNTTVQRKLDELQKGKIVQQQLVPLEEETLSTDL